jgi:hypothetical protein
MGHARTPLPAALDRRRIIAMSDTRPMTPEQAATLKELARAAYELVGRFHGPNHMPTKIGSLRFSCGMPGQPGNYGGSR